MKLVFSWRRRILIELGLRTEMYRDPLDNNGWDVSFSKKIQGTLTLKEEDGVSYTIAHEPEFGF